VDYTVSWSPEAAEDLESIADYILRDSEFYARAVVTKILAISRNISEQPLLYFTKRKTMSPAIFREGGFRFFFFSREEQRMHVHAYCGDGEAKFWLEPEIELAQNYRLSRLQLKNIEMIIGGHYHELTRAWQKHFRSGSY